MKKTFRFLALSLALICGTLSSFAAVTGQIVTTGDALVIYEATAEPDASDNVPVKITGLDADGLAALPNGVSLEIKTAFREKLGTKYYNFYVTEIVEGSNGVSFYGRTKIGKLSFVNDETNVANSKFTVAIKDKAFYGCTGLTEIELPANTKSIGANTFEGTAITKLELPKKCGDIAANAFYNCTSLEDVTVAEGNEDLKTIGTFVFGNSAIKTLNLSNATKLTTFTGTPFLYAGSQRNNQLSTVKLPASVTTIGTAFANCTALTKIEGFGSTKVTAIGDKAFENCSALTELNIPETAVVTGSPFVGCTSLAKITFEEGASLKRTLAIGDGSSLFGAAAADLAALKTLEFNVALDGTIEDNAFVGCTGLTTVNFNKSINAGSVIKAAFTNVESLTTVKFSGIDATKSGILTNVTFNTNAFSGIGATDISLGDITTGDGTVTIQANAFTSAALKNVTIGKVIFGALDGTLTVADNAFGGDAIESFKIGETTTATDGTPLGTVTLGVISIPENTLNTVELGNIACKTYTVADNAFKNKALANVKIGNILDQVNGSKTANTTVTFGTASFANTTPDAAAETAVKSTIEIGDVKANSVTINGYAFKGAAKKGSEYALTIKDITAALTNVAGYAFQGTYDADGKPNSVVAIGQIDNQPSNFVFDNVYKLTTGKWNISGGSLGLSFKGVVDATIGEIPTGKSIFDNQNTLTTLTFTGAIADANAIKTFASKKLRTITFPADKEVKAGAVSANAFSAAAQDIVDNNGSNMIVIYNPEEGIQNQIFNLAAFGALNDKQVVTLYTTDWCEKFIFSKVTINRLSASVAEIETTSFTVNVAKDQASTNYYGKMFIAQGDGQKFKVARTQGSATVNMYRGHLDGTNLYLKAIDPFADAYWFDASSKDMVFVVKSTTADPVAVTACTADEIATADTEEYWYEGKNVLRYAPAKVVNQELQNTTSIYNGKRIYVMANPAKYGLQFNILDPYGEHKNDLAAKSLYVLGTAAASRLNIIFEDEVEGNTTAIEKVENETVEDGAIYNLQGVRVKNAQKGIFIQNGKKVIK